MLATCWRRAPAARPSAAQLVAWLAAHPRALRPALAPLPDDGAAPASASGAVPAPAPEPEPDFCFDEWTA